LFVSGNAARETLRLDRLDKIRTINQAINLYLTRAKAMIKTEQQTRRTGELDYKEH